MALKTLVLAEVQHQPLALVLEDVHWIDKATEEVLGVLVEAMIEVPLLLVLVYRPAYVQSWIVQAIQTKAYAHQVPIEPLSLAQRTEMTRAPSKDVSASVDGRSATLTGPFPS